MLQQVATGDADARDVRRAQELTIFDKKHFVWGMTALAGARGKSGAGACGMAMSRCAAGGLRQGSGMRRAAAGTTAVAGVEACPAGRAAVYGLHFGECATGIIPNCTHDTLSPDVFSLQRSP